MSQAYFTLSTGKVLTEKEFEEVTGEILRRYQYNPIGLIALKLVGEIELIREGFPDYPIGDGDLARKFNWYKKQGMSVPTAQTLIENGIDPIKLLSVSLGEISSWRNIGPSELGQIKKWQQENMHKLPRKG